MSNLIKYKGGLYSLVERTNGQSEAFYLPVECVEDTPCYSRTGPKIPLDLYHRFCAYAEWSTEKYSCETQARLYFNPNPDAEHPAWKIWCFPQSRSGMTTRELVGNEFDEERDRQYVQHIGEGYFEYASFHHHVKASAFASGTDNEDEGGSSPRPGLHITIGNIGSDKYTIDGRVIAIRGKNKMRYGVLWSQWFEVPPEAAAALTTLGISGPAYDSILEEIVKSALTKPAPKDMPFPAEWKDNLKQEPARYNIGYHAGWNRGQMAQGSGSAWSRSTDIDWTGVCHWLYNLVEDLFEPKDLPLLVDLADKIETFMFAKGVSNFARLSGYLNLHWASFLVKKKGTEEEWLDLNGQEVDSDKLDRHFGNEWTT